VKRNIFAGGTGQDFRARARRANHLSDPLSREDARTISCTVATRMRK
jgi:hypothetical protein